MCSGCTSTPEEKTNSSESCCAIKTDEKVPTNFIERIFWKIGKADSQKDKKKKSSCCK